MTCNQLAGACDTEFRAETFQEMGELSRTHAMAMAEKGDQAHIDKINEMKALMTKPGAAEEWFANVQKQFDALPDDK